MGDEERGDHLPQITELFCSIFAYVDVFYEDVLINKENENN